MGLVSAPGKAQPGLGQLRAALCSPLDASPPLPSAGGRGGGGGGGGHMGGHCKGISALEQSPQLGTSGKLGYL